MPFFIYFGFSLKPIGRQFNALWANHISSSVKSILHCVIINQCYVKAELMAEEWSANETRKMISEIQIGSLFFVFLISTVTALNLHKITPRFIAVSQSYGSVYTFGALVCAFRPTTNYGILQMNEWRWWINAVSMLWENALWANEKGRPKNNNNNQSKDKYAYARIDLQIATIEQPSVQWTFGKRVSQ